MDNLDDNQWFSFPSSLERSKASSKKRKTKVLNLNEDKTQFALERSNAYRNPDEVDLEVIKYK